MGMILGKMSKWSDAIRALEDALEADPAFPETHINLLHIYTSLGALEKAEVAYVPLS